MWIFDKLFNRKIEGKSSLDDLAENVVVNKETNTTEIVGNLDVGGNITKNGQPIGGGSKEKVILTVKTATVSSEGKTILKDNSAANDKLAKVKVGDTISIIVKHGSTINEVVTLTCVTNELPFSGMGQHFICSGAGYCDNSGVNNTCSCKLDIGSSQDACLYLSDTASASTQHYSTLAVGDKVEIYF